MGEDQEPSACPRRRQSRADDREAVLGTAGGASCSTPTPTATDRIARPLMRLGYVGSGVGDRTGLSISIIKSFFDSVDHQLILKAVAAHTKERWVLLYVERWLKSPLDKGYGNLEARDRGTPQGPRSPRCSPTYICTTRSIRGWPGVPVRPLRALRRRRCRAHQK